MCTTSPHEDDSQFVQFACREFIEYFMACITMGCAMHSPPGYHQALLVPSPGRKQRPLPQASGINMIVDPSPEAPPPPPAEGADSSGQGSPGGTVRNEGPVEASGNAVSLIG